MTQNTCTPNRSPKETRIQGDSDNHFIPNKHVRKRTLRNRRRRYAIRLFFILFALLCVYCKCFQKISEFWRQANTVSAGSDSFFTNIGSNNDLSNINSNRNFTNIDNNRGFTNTDGGGCISLKGLSQDGIPTGCESVSTVSVLQYWNIDITPDTFISEYLPCQAFWKEDGVTYGPDPDEYFAGNPYESGSLGCFANVILKALTSMQEQNYPGTSELQFSETNDLSLSALSDNYVSSQIPVIVWVTMDMKASYEGMQYYLADGTPYVWIAREHCMVLCGYDEKYYYLMDPLADGELVSYEKELCQQRFEELGQQAVIVRK